MTSAIWSLLCVLVLASVHLLAPRLDRGVVGRPTWLAIASGVAVAYVFVDLLPQLAEAQRGWLAARPDRALIWLERQVYIALLIGVLLALGLQLAESRKETQAFWVHTGAFAIYNLLIGVYAVELETPVAVAFATFAFGAHLLVNDRSLYMHHRREYERAGRWVLAAALPLGWLLEVASHPPFPIMAALLGLVSGDMIISVIKEELPERMESRFAAFAAGAVLYALLLLSMSYAEHSHAALSAAR